MTYAPQTWNNGPEGGTPVSADRLNYLEQGVAGVSADADGKAPLVHTHTSAQITSGVFAAARLPAATETAIGAVERATQAEATAGTDSTRYITPATLRAVGDSRWANPGTVNARAVFVGSSNVADGSTPANMWPSKLCAMRGWTKHNHAIAGSAYTNTNNFLSQAQAAVAAMSTAERAEVGHFFVADASNNSRAKTPTADVLTAAKTLYAYIRTNFPNARLVVIPQIWPSDTSKYAPSAFPYEQVWNAWAIAHAEAQKEALWDFPDALFVDESWTWLTGLDQYMTALNDVHPNAAGMTVLANFIDRELDGETIVGSQPWTPATVTASATLGGRGRPLAARRRGWDVAVEGSATWAIAAASGWDIATLPYGCRPTYVLPIKAVRTDTWADVPVELWPTGAVRIYTALPINTVVWMNSSYQLG